MSTYPGIILDVSCGIQASTLEKFYSLISQKAPKVRMIQCDSMIHSDIVIETKDWDYHNLILFGRGGSDMSPAFEALEEDPNIDCIIICTDGLVYWRKTPTKPVEWIIDHNEGFSCDFGTIYNLTEVTRRPTWAF